MRPTLLFRCLGYLGEYIEINVCLIKYKTKHPKSKSFRCFFDTVSNMSVLIQKQKKYRFPLLVGIQTVLYFIRQWDSMKP